MSRVDVAGGDGGLPSLSLGKKERKQKKKSGRRPRSAPPRQIEKKDLQKSAPPSQPNKPPPQLSRKLPPAPRFLAPIRFASRFASRDEEEAIIDSSRTDCWPGAPLVWIHNEVGGLRNCPRIAYRIRSNASCADRRKYLRGEVIRIAEQFADAGIPYFAASSAYAKEYADPTAEAWYANHVDHAQDDGKGSEMAKVSLDCCGLVRAVFWELYRQKEIAFRIRRFNQNYQRRCLAEMDPHGSKIISLKDVQPGDLVFYIAKPKEGAVGMESTQPVRHVEIMVGDGSEASIGSRWGGVVKRHASYKFESSRWEVIAREFRSIDPWLRYQVESSALVRRSAYHSVSIGSHRTNGTVSR